MVFVYMDCLRLGEGRAIAQAVSRWLPTAAVRGSSPGLVSGICGRESGAGAGFLRVLRFPLPIFIPPNSPLSQSLGAGTIGHSVAGVPSRPSSTPHYANKKMRLGDVRGRLCSVNGKNYGGVKAL
jgi:hypothetical protein